VASDPMDKRRCTARSRSGEQCRRAPVAGALVCSMHGGKAPQVKAAARTRVIEASAARQLRADGYESTTINPVEELLRLGSEVVAFKDIPRARVADLDDSAWLTASKLNVDDVSALVRAYERSLDRCERTLANMLRLDLEARQVRIAEHDAEVVWQATMTALEAIGASTNAERFRAVLAETIRAAA